MTSRKQTYSKKDQISHVLDRPDMYVGSVRVRSAEEFVVVDDKYRVERREVSYSPASLRIFIELLSNVIDNVARSRKAKKPVKKICVTLDKETGETSFWNDGLVIPIELHDEEKCYNHTLIFGHLLTSSNYDDEDERLDISGRNGVGAKATNVFSTRFTVSGCDPDAGKTFSQTWTKNMKVAGKPVVKSTKLKGGYTKITYTPDFARLGFPDGYTDDLIGLYRKYIVDMAMITRVPVHYNGEVVPVENLTDYARLYARATDDPKEVLSLKTSDCEVVLTPAASYECISFANGVCTPLGGTHVDAWCEALFRPIVDRMNKPKQPQINIKDVKNCFRLFVIARVPNPKFESQNKCKLEEPSVVATVKRKSILTVCKWRVIARLEDIIRSKEMLALKKVERKKRGFTKIEAFDAANNEGGRLGRECTFIAVEGLSAKAFAVSGIDTGAFGKSGRDWFGIYPLRGKLLNCRNTTAKMIAKNRVVTEIIKALGLRMGVDYTDDAIFNTLRYGRVLILTDADVDGIHISGLIQNMFHSMFPSLLQRSKPFLVAMQTPIVRITMSRGRQKLFYDERVYRKFVARHAREHPTERLKHKYYKGLGTVDEEMSKEIFGVKLVELVCDEKTTESMVKVFHNKYADARKLWLANYDPTDVRLVWDEEKEETLRLSMRDFLDTEMIKFSIDDCKRSIPSLMDGLKESQRKILYVAFLRNLRAGGTTYKVAQFGARVAEKSAYHHGEQNLQDTIIKMAANYVGNNNIPLFYRDGQFGTRLSGGKDAGNARYIYTRLEALTRLLFHPDDDELLARNEDDGEIVEPVVYVPVLPMILVNGCTAAIGTGWSSTIPCYNPEDLVAAIRVWLDHDGKVLSRDGDEVRSLFPPLKPWYRDFTGRIEGEGDKYTTYGRVTPVEKTIKGKRVAVKGKVLVDELPIGMWTDKFRSMLDSWCEEKAIRGYVDHSTTRKVHFTLTESKDGFLCNEANLKLKSTLRLTNMVMFDADGSLKRYNTVDEILDDFCRVRYRYYKLRKANNLKKMEAELTLLGNKKRFLEAILQGKLQLFIKNGKRKVARSTDSLVTELSEAGYDRIRRSVSTDEDGNEDEEQKDHGYQYLLGMQFRSITADRIEKLKNDLASLEERRNELAGTSEKEIWIRDLDAFMKAYPVWLKSLAKQVKGKARGRGATGKSRKKR